MLKRWDAGLSPGAGPAAELRAPPAAGPEGPFAAAKRYMKRHGRLYTALRRTFSPLHRCHTFHRELSRVLARNPPGQVVLNLGSGPFRLRGCAHSVNLDMELLPGVDVVADVQALPLADSCADLVLHLDILEHVRDPRALVRETHRVLRAGGEVLAFVPFLYPVHHAPADFGRFTPQGLEALFGGFAACRVGVAAGPLCATLLVLRDLTATAGSLGWRPLYDLIYVLFSVAAAPVKLLDETLVRLPTAPLSAGAYYVAATK